MSLSLFVLIASTVLTVKGQIDSAKSQEIEFERQAEEEKISAEGRELQRRQKLNKVLAANIVGVSTSGISGEGTPASIALESAKQSSLSEGIEGLSTRLKQAQLKRQGKNVRAAGNIQAASTLLKGGFEASKLI